MPKALLETLDNMERYGGSFAKALAKAWLLADSHNQSRLAAAFPELLESYAPAKWPRRGEQDA